MDERRQSVQNTGKNTSKIQCSVIIPFHVVVVVVVAAATAATIKIGIVLVRFDAVSGFGRAVVRVRRLARSGCSCVWERKR